MCNAGYGYFVCVLWELCPSTADFKLGSSVAGVGQVASSWEGKSKGKFGLRGVMILHEIKLKHTSPGNSWLMIEPTLEGIRDLSKSSEACQLLEMMEHLQK